LHLIARQLQGSRMGLVAEGKPFTDFLCSCLRSWHRFYAGLSSMHRLRKGGGNHGRGLPLTAGWFLCDFRLGCLRLRAPQEAVMSWLYALSGIVALAITIYLVIALLFPEKF